MTQRQRFAGALGGALQRLEDGGKEHGSSKASLPGPVKAGMESLSGYSFDHVQVQYNSLRPAQLNAHAYAQGNEIHLAPGQERHLPHEAWHLVQQAQGRVRPTMDVGGVPVNDHPALEHEAEVMGSRAAMHAAPAPQVNGRELEAPPERSLQRVAQRVVIKEVGEGEASGVPIHAGAPTVEEPDDEPGGGQNQEPANNAVVLYQHIEEEAGPLIEELPDDHVVPEGTAVVRPSHVEGPEEGRQIVPYRGGGRGQAAGRQADGRAHLLDVFRQIDEMIAQAARMPRFAQFFRTMSLGQLWSHLFSLMGRPGLLAGLGAPAGPLLLPGPAPRLSLGHMPALMPPTRPPAPLFRPVPMTDLERRVREIDVQGRPPHRQPAEVTRLATLFPELDANELLLLLRLPAQRSVTNLRYLVNGKPAARTLAHVAGLAAAFPALSIANVLQLATLPPARAAEIPHLVANWPVRLPFALLIHFASGLPARSAADLLTLAELSPGRTAADIVLLGGAGAHRSGLELVFLATRLPALPAASIVTLANVPGRAPLDLVHLCNGISAARTVADLALMATQLHAVPAHLLLQLAALPTLSTAELVHIVQNRPPGLTEAFMIGFAEHVAPRNLTAAQLLLAVQLPGLLNVAQEHAFVSRILSVPLLLGNLTNVCTVLQSGPILPHVQLIACMERTPANLGPLATHIVALNTALNLLSPQGQARIPLFLGSDHLVSQCDLVAQVITAGTNVRYASLVNCMLRSNANLGNLVLHIVDLNHAAATLATADLRGLILGSDLLVANGGLTRTVITTGIHLDRTILLSVMSRDLNTLNRLNQSIADVDRALTGQAGLTEQRLLNVLDHIQHVGAPGALGGAHDADLQDAQTFGAHTQDVLASPLAGFPAYMNNLRAAVTTLNNVVWDWQGGTFSRTGWAGNFGGAIYVPVNVNGFDLSNHVIAHLINPQDNAHRVTVSNIITATGNFSGTVRDYSNGGWSDHYYGNGMTMVTPNRVYRIKTIFFDR